MTQPIPFLGHVQAGFPSPASDYMEDGIDLNKRLIRRPSSTFFFRIEGESMTGAHIPHGAVVVVDKSLRPRNNAVVIAVVNGEFTCKFYVVNKEGCALVPANPKFRTVVIDGDTDFQVWGVVTAVIIETLKYGL